MKIELLENLKQMLKSLLEKRQHPVFSGQGNSSFKTTMDTKSATIRKKEKGKPTQKRKGNLNTETRTFNHPRKDVPRGREN